MTQSVIWVVKGTQIKALVTFAYDLLMLEESFWQKNMVRSQCLNAFFLHFYKLQFEQVCKGDAIKSFDLSVEQSGER